MIRPLNIEQRVIRVVCDKFCTTPDQVSLDTSLEDDLGADSLDTVELVIACEEEFSIVLPDDEEVKVTTVGDVVEFFKKKFD